MGYSRATQRDSDYGFEDGWRVAHARGRKRRRWRDGRVHWLVGLALLVGGLVGLVGAGRALANVLIYPSLGTAALSYAYGTVRETWPDRERYQCYAGFRIEGLGRALHYGCGMPEYDRLRSAARRGQPVELWYEPVGPLPDLVPLSIWQARVNGELVVDQRAVAEYYRGNVWELLRPLPLLAVGIALACAGGATLAARLRAGLRD